MRVLNGYITIVSSILFLVFLLFNAGGSMAGQIEPENEPKLFELKAPIMEINLENELMIVAEKEIHLLTFMEDGEKKWKTVFMDDSGKEISVELFKRKDRIRINGVKSLAGRIDAYEISLLPAEQMRQPSRPSSSPVKLQRGVWTNK